MEWRSVVVSDESRFSLYACMDVHVYGVDQVSVIFWSAFAHDTQAPPQASWCGAISYNSQSHLVYLQGKVNCSLYIAKVFNHMLLSFLRQEGVVHFQQDNACLHTAAVPQRVLRGVQLPWSAITQDLSLIEHVWNILKRELTLPP